MRLNIGVISLSVLLLLPACGGGKPPVPPKPKVAVVEVLKADVPIYSEAVGETLGSTDIAIRARVDGELTGLHFREGFAVKKGDLLYTIDSQPFEANVLAVEGEVAAAETKLVKAEADLKRIRPLAKINAVSKRELDAAVAARDAAAATVESAKARLDYAKIQLGYTKVHSPIDGVIGLTKAKVGDYVGKEPNPVVLNMVSQTNPIHVRATISEAEYLSFARRFMEEGGRLSDNDAQKRRKKDLELILADGSSHKHPGRVVAANSQVDPSTGTLTFEAAFPNPNILLRPGQFARIKFVKEMRKGALVVWQRAVQELQSVHQVYVVKEDGSTELRQVRVGEKLPGVWIIKEGLKEGEKVIVDGALKVRPGVMVQALAPKELGVTPPESEVLGVIEKS